MEKHGKTNTSKAKPCRCTPQDINTQNSSERTLPTTFGWPCGVGLTLSTERKMPSYSIFP